MQQLQRYLIYLAIILMPIQDCILGKSPLGYLGSNISFLPITLSALVGVTARLYRGNTRVSVWGVLWLVYALGLSVAYIIVWGPVSHGFSVIYKTIAEGIVFCLWAYVIFAVDYTPTAGLRISTYIAFIILIFGVLACDIRVPGLAAIGSSAIFHVTPSYELDRWRSFSMEPSTFSATVVSLGLASAYFARRKIARRMFVAITVILLIASQSKGGLLVLVISAFALLLLKKPSPLRLSIYLLACLAVGAATIAAALHQVTGAERLIELG